MAVTATLSNHFKFHLAKGDIDFDAHTIKIILMNSSFTFNKDTHETYADVLASELATAYGYTQGAKVLPVLAITEDDTNDRTSITFSSVSWTASGGNIGPTNGAIIYDDSEAADVIIGYLDFGSAQTVTDGGTFGINSVEIRMA